MIFVIDHANICSINGYAWTKINKSPERISSYLQEEVDAGAIIVQEAVPVVVNDTEESLSERIREAEHRAFPAALELVASGALKLGEDGRIIWNSTM